MGFLKKRNLLSPSLPRAQPHAVEERDRCAFAIEFIRAGVSANIDVHFGVIPSFPQAARELLDTMVGS
jgi:hypothetical protein